MKKYAGERFDLIIALAAESLNFLLNEGKELPPGSQCVAVIAGDNQSPGQAGRMVTHIPIKLDIRGTLERGLELFPGTRKVIFMAGDRRFENLARTELAPWQGRLEFEYTTERSFEELKKYVAQPHPDTLIIFSSIRSNPAEQARNPAATVKSLTETASAPILGLFSNQIDAGVIGGSLVDMERVGTLLA